MFCNAPNHSGSGRTSSLSTKNGQASTTFSHTRGSKQSPEKNCLALIFS